MSDSKTTDTEKSQATTGTERSECEQSKPLSGTGRKGRGRGKGKAGRPKTLPKPAVKGKAKPIVRAVKPSKKSKRKHEGDEFESEETSLSPETNRIAKAESNWNASQKKNMKTETGEDHEGAASTESEENDQPLSSPKSSGLIVPWRDDEKLSVFCYILFETYLEGNIFAFFPQQQHLLWGL